MEKMKCIYSFLYLLHNNVSSVIWCMLFLSFLGLFPHLLGQIFSWGDQTSRAALYCTTTLLNKVDEQWSAAFPYYLLKHPIPKGGSLVVILGIFHFKQRNAIISNAMNIITKRHLLNNESRTAKKHTDKSNGHSCGQYYHTVHSQQLPTDCVASTEKATLLRNLQ